MTENNRKTSDTDDNFDRLLDRRVEIADFVNSFTSERVQRKAFEAIVCSLGLVDDAPEAPTVERLHIVPKTPDSGEHDEPRETASSEQQAGESPAAEGGRRRRSRSTVKKSFSIPKGLNWAPDGQPSLEDFIEDKQPRNNHEKNLVACFYLTHMMGLSIDTEHVLAVYQAAKWDAPTQPTNSLQITASRHAWIDTADMKDIKVVWQGENYVNNKMPVEATKKKSG